MKQYVKKIAKLPILMLYHLFICLNKTSRKVILFESNLGRNYSGNPRFIYEAMVARGLDKVYQCYFILEDMSIELPGKVKKVKRISMMYFYLFAKAGIWVSDTRMPTYLRKRKNTIYIQTWHGTPLKKLALDMFQVTMEGETSLEKYKKNFVKNSSTWDYLLSQNSYSTGIFRRAFDYHKEILEVGYPRNDILIHKDNIDDINQLKNKLKLPLNKKIILYAPTWRDNEHYGTGSYKFSTQIDYSYLKKELSSEYIVLVKAHYLVGEKITDQSYENFLYQFGASYDIAELYLVSDLLVTDYSSVMFDYSILQRPMIFYTYDLDQYKNTLRGFYFDFLEVAPGPIVITNEQLVKAIREYSYDQNKVKYQAFKQKYNHADQGNASDKVVDIIHSFGGK